MTWENAYRFYKMKMFFNQMMYEERFDLQGILEPEEQPYIDISVCSYRDG